MVEGMRRTIAALILLAAIPIALPAQKDLGRVLPEDRPLHVAAFGDYGSGNQHQAAVAHTLQQRNAQAPFDLGITMGDNFYFCGVRNVKDPKWQTRWEKLYSSLGIRFYASLGNHDYGHPTGICPFNRASPDAEVAYTEHSKSWTMPARYYTFAAGPVRFFAIDTEGWSAAQLEWIESALAASANEPGIRWRIVYGHHPVSSSGFHATERRIGQLLKELLPVMTAAKVDLYISGHDHDMEHLHLNDIDLLVCGTGGAKLRGAAHHPKPQSVFTASVYGFLDLTIDPNRLTAQFFDTALKPLEHPALTLTHK
jgi:predicted MPP superfamily phosphohydrolase